MTRQGSPTLPATNVSTVLLHILVVLLAAKGSAELAERVHLPAVVGEIVAGVLIGPSVLGLVRGDDVLRVLGELGVILLLLEVGLEMDLGELGAVGRASMSVAMVGVVVPFAAGFGTGLAFSMTSKEALFVGAALTATSVGITARVFGDLRALATVEARTVLGAAVADDVIGLVILTVVVRIATEGSVSVGGVLGVVGVAVGFLVLTTVAGTRVAPLLFNGVARFSRSSGTLVAMAFAFTLAIAELANAAKLAPIVGAFVAGLSLGRSRVAPRIRRELSSVGHLFIPVFFLQIGIDADVKAFAHWNVIGLAAVLLVVAVLGKIVAAVGLIGSPGDRLLVGIGMIPRGEVGLIFATIGLRQGVFGQDVYAALLLVVLVTTLVTPPALKARLAIVRARHERRQRTGVPGRLQVEIDGDERTVELVGDPAPDAALELALDAALRCEQARPGASLLDWLSTLPDTPMAFTDDSRERFVDLLERGGPRSWRLLATTGVLDRALPELAEAMARRQSDLSELDPLGVVKWPYLSRVIEEGNHRTLAHPERVLLAAVILDASHDTSSPETVARRVMQRIQLDPETDEDVVQLVASASLLGAAARRTDAFTEEAVLPLASHIGSASRAEELHVLAEAAEDDPDSRRRLATLYQLVQAALARPDLTGRDVTDLVERRRADAVLLARDRAVAERIAAAPRAYVLAFDPAELARQAAICEPPLGARTARVAVVAIDGFTDRWRVDIVARDRIGLLARETALFAESGIDVLDAVIATWADRHALGSFVVTSERLPVAATLARELEATFDRPLAAPPVDDADVVFDDDGSPWHTLCTIVAKDRPGLLRSVTAAFAATGIDVHAARVRTTDGMATDRFELTTRTGSKVDAGRQRHVVDALRDGVAARSSARKFRNRKPTRSGNR